MNKTIRTFSDSDIKKQMELNSDIVYKIEQFETFLYKNNYVNESYQTMLISSFYIKYFKDGDHILTIHPYQNYWDLDINIFHFDIVQLALSGLEMFIQSKSMAWRLREVNTIENLNELINKSFGSNGPLSLIPYVQSLNLILTAHQNTYYESLYNFEEISSLFWKGKFEDIERLKNIEHSTTFFYEEIYQLIQNWGNKLGVEEYSQMDLSNIKLTSVETFDSIRSLVEIVVTSIRKSVNNAKEQVVNSLFTDSSILDKEGFLKEVEDYRLKFEQCVLFINSIENAISILSTKELDQQKDQNLTSKMDETENKIETITKSFNEYIKTCEIDSTKNMFIREVIRGTNNEGLFLASVVKSRFRFGLRKNKIYGNDLSEKYINELIEKGFISETNIGSKIYGAFNQKLWKSINKEMIYNNLLKDTKAL